MFDIEYKGRNAIVIATKKDTLVIDPKLSDVGLKDVQTKDKIAVATEARLASLDKEAKLLIEGPGEYEISDFSIRGVPVQRHIDTDKDELLGTMYRVEVGDVRLAVLGNATGKLTDDQLEALGVVDILILPVGGSGLTLDATSAATLTRQIDPKVVIPVHYADPAISYEMPQDSLEVFVKEMGAPVETVPKYKLKGSTSLPVALTLVELTRS